MSNICSRRHSAPDYPAPDHIAFHATPRRSQVESKSRYNASNICVNEYSPIQLEHLAVPTKFYFATLPNHKPQSTNPIISKLFQPVTCETLLSPKQPSFLHSLHSLRCHPTFSCFNIYPTTANSLKVNNLLWHTVSRGSYDPSDGDPLLGAHVFVLGIAPELHEFLSTVSLDEMHRAIIDFLVLLHHQLTTDGDNAGLAKLKEDLVPEIWDKLNGSIGTFPNGEPTEPRRSKVLENLVQISFMTPWRVDIFAAYLTANDVTGLVDVLHTDRFEATPCRYILANDNRRGPERAQGKVMLKLYQDWRVFAAVLHDGMGLGYHLVAEAMERAVYAEKSAGLLEQAFTALEASENKMSFLSRLPTDVLERKIIPWVIRRGCEAIPPRRRRFASLKSLLEISSRYLEELQADDAFPADMSDETVSMLASLLDPSAGGNSQGAESTTVTTTDRIGLGILTDRVLNNEELEEFGHPTENPVVESLQDGSAGHIHNMRSTESPGPPPPTPPRFAVESVWIYPLENVPWNLAEEASSEDLSDYSNEDDPENGSENSRNEGDIAISMFAGPHLLNVGESSQNPSGPEEGEVNVLGSQQL